MRAGTIYDRVKLADNRPSGFDYLRITLSLSVIAWHTITVSYGPKAELPYWTGPARPFLYFILPAFFALSGFLVAGSLERNDLPSFVTLRILRILPALVVEIIVSALLIGPLFTTFALRDYFGSRIFYRYMLNCIGYIHYVLPGVFHNLPTPDFVNLQLWTVPYELECYAAITLLSLFRIPRRPLAFLSLLLAAVVFLTMREQFHPFVTFASRPPGRLLLLSFLFGILLYFNRQRIPCSFPLFAASAVLYVFFVMNPSTVYATAIPVAYMTVFLGVQNPRRVFLVAGADYSYGMYLYGFPVQQVISALFPAYRHWWFNLVCSVAISGAIAFISWNLVELKVLDQRKSVLGFVALVIAHLKGRLRTRFCLHNPVRSTK